MARLMKLHRDEVFDKIPHDVVPSVLIQDAGLTQIAAGSKTVLGIGPCNMMVLFVI